MNQPARHTGHRERMDDDAERGAYHSDTRRIAARIFGALPVPVVWDDRAKASVGRLSIPEGLPSGTYTIQVTAVDFAHNSSTTELTIEVLGRQ